MRDWNEKQKWFKTVRNDYLRRGSRGGRVFTSVCLFVCLSVFCTISQKPMQLESANLTKKCFTMNPRNPCIFRVQRSKVKITRHKNAATAWVLTLLWVLASSYTCVQRLLREWSGREWYFYAIYTQSPILRRGYTTLGCQACVEIPAQPPNCFRRLAPK